MIIQHKLILLHDMVYMIKKSILRFRRKTPFYTTCIEFKLYEKSALTDVIQWKAEHHGL